MNNKFKLSNISVNQLGFSPIVIFIIIALLVGLLIYISQSFKTNNKPSSDSQPVVKAKNVIILTSSDVQLPAVEGLRTGLKDLGYTEGQNINLTLKNAKSDKAVMTKIAEEAVAANPDLIIIFSTSGTKTLQKALNGKVMPVVFVDVGNFKDLGISNIQQPGNKITGVVADSIAFAGKRMEIFKELLPGMKNFALIAEPKHTNFATDKAIHEEEAKKLGLNLKIYLASDHDELVKVLSQIKVDKPDALGTATSTLISAESKTIAKAMREAKIPAMDHDAERGVNDGYLMMYGLYRPQTGKLGAKTVDKVLKGEDPGIIPIEFNSTLNLEINKTVASDIGVVIPNSLTLRAKRVFTEK